MKEANADVVICGAGIAGIAAAYHLTVGRGVKRVVIVDERPPLSLTSDQSTECYRIWWPGPDDAMIRLMNRSVDILESLAHGSGNPFRLNRRGYLYATADRARAREMLETALRAAEQGAGPVRQHAGQAGEEPYRGSPEEGFEGVQEGCDFISDRSLIRERFPVLSTDVVALLHVRRAGWLSAQQLGTLLLERARNAGASLIADHVQGVETEGGRVRAVTLAGLSGLARIATPAFVAAPGPFLQRVAAMLGVTLPVFCELHARVALRDALGVIPRDSPLLIWSDPQALPWSAEERAELAGSTETGWLLGSLPEGAHARPEGPRGSNVFLGLWSLNPSPVEPVFPPRPDPWHAEIVLRGLGTMLPGLRSYFTRLPTPRVDAGYYTRTAENRPIIGPLPVEGAFVLGALSGFGVMASAAAGELLAAHVTGATLPSYASAFALERYEDPDYQERFAHWAAASAL